MDNRGLQEALIANYIWGEKLIDRIVEEFRMILADQLRNVPVLASVLTVYKQEKLQLLKDCWSEDTWADLQKSEEYLRELKSLLQDLLISRREE